jgi:PAS domain S-box-containing protein
VNNEVEAIVEDITEEKLFYEKMMVTQERYEKLFRFSGDMVIICGMDGLLIEEANPIAEKVTGFTLEELTGMPLEKLFHPSGKAAINGAKEDLMFRGAARIEEIVVSKDGFYKEAVVTLTAVDLSEGRAVMAVVKDVSSMARELEEQRRRHDELEEFQKASILREERIAQLREELRMAKLQIDGAKKKK